MYSFILISTSGGTNSLTNFNIKIVLHLITAFELHTTCMALFIALEFRPYFTSRLPVNSNQFYFDKF